MSGYIKNIKKHIRRTYHDNVTMRRRRR